MKKERIEALIKDALKESTFVHHLYGEVSLAKNTGISVFLHPEFESGIDLDEDENKVSFNIEMSYDTNVKDGIITKRSTFYNFDAILSKDSALIKQPIHIREL